jgi:hypothetical protein
LEALTFSFTLPFSSSEEVSLLSTSSFLAFALAFSFGAISVSAIVSAFSTTASSAATSPL